MLQTMTHVAQWLARDSDSEANVDQAMRRSFIGESKSFHNVNQSGGASVENPALQVFLI
jgi:hypothetical protein